jgi:hypothetical protein
MRTVTYDVFPALGPESMQEQGNLLQFVLDIPYLFAFGLVPPIQVLNDIFMGGGDLHGMSGGCQWEPFAIEPQEYDELAHALQAVPGSSYRFVEPPAWVMTAREWHVWTMEHEIGIPHEEYSELNRENDEWTRLATQARDVGDEDLALEYHVKGLDAGRRLVEFMEPFMVAYRARKHHS